MGKFERDGEMVECIWSNPPGGDHVEIGEVLEVFATIGWAGGWRRDRLWSRHYCCTAGREGIHRCTGHAYVFLGRPSSYCTAAFRPVLRPRSAMLDELLAKSPKRVPA